MVIYDNDRSVILPEMSTIYSKSVVAGRIQNNNHKVVYYYSLRSNRSIVNQLHIRLIRIPTSSSVFSSRFVDIIYYADDDNVYANCFFFFSS